MRRSPGTLALGILLLTLLGPHAPIARATTVVVPDDVATIQAGLTLADTVLVRSGTYPDSFMVNDSDGHSKAVIRHPESTIQPVVGKATLHQDYGALMTLSGLHCAAPLRLVFYAADGHMVIDSCAVDSGVGVSVGDIIDAFLTLEHNTVRGGMSGVFESLTLDSDSLIAGVIAIDGEGEAVAARCVFASSGLWCFSQGGVTATHCRFDGCNRGIWTHDGSLVARSSTFVNCGLGIEADYDLGAIDSCTFVDCPWGIDAGTGNGRITHNQVTGSTHVGIDAYVDRIEDNVVAHCHEGGIRFAPAYEGSSARGNTCYDNGGWGFQMLGGSNAIANNIGFRNHGYGFDGRGAPAATLSCNDWFENDSSAVVGLEPSSQDLAVDPQFCAVDSDDVHLNASSPLLNAPGCGQIGALGQGCATTPTLVTAFTAERTDQGVRLTWSIGNPSRFPVVWLERSEGGSRSWTRLALDVVTDGARAIALDGSALPDRAYSYRLTANSGGGVIVLGQAVTVAAGSPLAFTLQRVAPNPSTGPLHVEFSLARAAFVASTFTTWPAAGSQSWHAAPLRRAYIASTGPAWRAGVRGSTRCATGIRAALSLDP